MRGAMPFVRTLSLVVPVALAAACGSGSSSVAAVGPYATSLERAADAHGVPRDLVVAIAQVEGGLAMPAHRDVDVDATVPVAGPLELRHGAFDSLARGAALLSTTELALRQDADLGLEAGVRVLADVGARLGASGDDLASWGAAIEEMGGYADAPHRAKYMHRVFALLARGGTFAGRDGEAINLPAHPEIPFDLQVDVDTTTHIEGGAEYPGAEWFPTDCTNKCDTTRNGYSVTEIAIHDTEGGWDASVATLQNDPGKSVHYIVDTDGTVGQFVPESYTAWHVGNYWYNEHMVGIEHVGYFNQPYPDAEYAASAKLVSYLAAKYAVPTDRAHVLGHDQVPNGDVMPEDSPPCEASPAVCETGTSYGGSDNHRDPGDWAWCAYMAEVAGGVCKCNDDDCEAGGASATDGGEVGDAAAGASASSGGCAVVRGAGEDAGFAAGVVVVAMVAVRRRGRKRASRGHIGRERG
jgi:hypothetical protein